MINYIYTLSNPITNEIRYVGKSIKPNERVRKHINEAKNSKTNNHRINWIKSLLAKDLKPKMEIIDTIDGDWEWLEEYWISQFRTWGFNLVNGTNGGENPPSWLGKTHTKEHILKMQKGREKWWKSLENGLPEEWKKNISSAHKNNNYYPTNAIEKNKIKVNQYSLNGEFIQTWNSITEASHNVKLKNISGIRQVCLGQRFKAGGFRWCYENSILFDFIFKPKGNKGISKSTIEKAKEANQIKVHQYSLIGELIKTWNSITEAGLELNLKSYSGITEVCRNKKFMCGGFRWTYINEKLKPYKLIIGKSVRQLDLNGNLIKEWNSTHDIQLELGFKGTSISRVCSGDRKTYKKFKWEWVQLKKVINN